MKRCWQFLDDTSRSFAAVIKELEGELTRVVRAVSLSRYFREREALTRRAQVCIFYLVLRALDTVEDDMTLDINLKVDTLTHFHEKLYEEGWCFTQSASRSSASSLSDELIVKHRRTEGSG